MNNKEKYLHKILDAVVESCSYIGGSRLSITKEDIEEMEVLANIISSIIEKRNELGISQRELADICGLPHSSVARIESCAVKPKVETLIKIMKPLGLTLTAKAI